MKERKSDEARRLDVESRTQLDTAEPDVLKAAEVHPATVAYVPDDVDDGEEMLHGEYDSDIDDQC